MPPRPILIKSWNVLIENCTIHDCHLPVIQAGAEMYRDEDPRTLNLMVRGSIFENITRLQADYHLPAGRLSSETAFSSTTDSARPRGPQ